jgi:hypothetical protein
MLIFFEDYAKHYLSTHAFIMELEECGVTISTSNGLSVPAVDDSFGVLVEFLLAGVHQNACHKLHIDYPGIKP